LGLIALHLDKYDEFIILSIGKFDNLVAYKISPFYALNVTVGYILIINPSLFWLKNE
jgi:hypothetical protein